MLEKAGVRLGTGLILLVFWTGLYLAGYSLVSARIMSVLSIVTVIFILVRAYWLKNELMLLFLVFLLAYSKVSMILFFDGIPISAHEAFGLPENIFDALSVHTFFLIVLGMSLKMKKCIPEAKPAFLRNDVLFYFSCLIFLLGIIFGIRGENIFVSGGYSAGEVETSSMNEYVIIFFVCAYIYSGGTKSHLNFLKILAAVFILKNMAFGGRIVSLMLMLALFALHYQYRLKFKMFVLLALVGYLFMFAFESIRQNPWAFINGDYSSVFFSSKQEELVHVSNQGDVLQASSRLVGMVNENIISIQERLMAVLFFFISIFFPYSYLPAIANLASYQGDTYVSGGGGLLSAYFYVFGGYFAVALIAMYVGRFLSSPSSGKYSVRYFYFVMLIFTFPRWFAYNPIILFKLCFYGVVVFIFYKIFDRTMKKRRLPDQFFIKR